jgi:phage shock protein A
MNIFSRVMDIVNANVTVLLEKAEDPEKMIRLMIKEMEDTIVELKTSCASTMAQEKRLTKKSLDLKASIKRWESRAILAIEHEREDLAKEALFEKKKAQDEEDKTQRELYNAMEYIKHKKADIATIETKLVNARNKYKSIKEQKAREAQEAKDHIYESPYEDKYDWSENYDRMNINGEFKKENTDKKFEDLEKMSEIEKELEELKNKLRK